VHRGRVENLINGGRAEVLGTDHEHLEVGRRLALVIVGDAEETLDMSQHRAEAAGDAGADESLIVDAGAVLAAAVEDGKIVGTDEKHRWRVAAGSHPLTEDRGTIGWGIDDLDIVQRDVGEVGRDRLGEVGHRMSGNGRLAPFEQELIGECRS